MKLKKVTYTYEVLMPVEDNHSNMSLERIESECLTGMWSGELGESKVEVIEGKEDIQEACDKQGTDIHFFFEEY